MKIPFSKMNGTGNDFIVIDNRQGFLRQARKADFSRRICVPKTSIGADGVIFIENSKNADFRWDFFNSDGSSAEMCGNGGRCVARYAFEHRITSDNLTFETLAGTIAAQVKEESVKIKFPSPQDFHQDLEVFLNGTIFKVDFINTGVPHAVIYSNDVDSEDLLKIGSGIRSHEIFAPAGVNVDFVQAINLKTIKIRTYERGIEGETLACGTGAVASAILANRKGLVEAPVQVQVASGEKLKIYFDGIFTNGSFGDVFLEGPAVTTFEGIIDDS